MKLDKTKAYLAGPMQYTEDGESWREDIGRFLKGIGVKPFDPYKNVFVNDKQETNDKTGLFRQLRNTEQWDELALVVRKTRALDLRIVDVSDFLIVYVNVEHYTCGAWEELFLANSQMKPIFVVVEGGKKNCPLWLFGTLPHHYIYESFDELKKTLEGLNSGSISMDSDRWKLFLPEYR